MALNFDYLSRIRPLNEEEPSNMPELGRMPSNSGNVEDFNDKNSELSQGTAGLLSSMRMQREAEKREKATPLSEKLFRIEMANRQAKQKAAMYMKERELSLQEEKLKYDRIKDSAALARAEADKEELRSKERAKGELDYNSGYMKFIQDTGKAPSPEARAEYDSIMKPGQSVQAVQTPQVQTERLQKKTMGQFWKDKEREKAIKTSIIKLQEKTGHAFTPEEEQLPDEDKYNRLLNISKETKSPSERIQEGANKRQANNALPKMVQDVQSTNDVLKKIDQFETKLGFKLEDYNGQDIPGFTLPVIGSRVVYGGDSTELSNMAQGIYNAKIYDSSGKAVNEGEMQRILSELGVKGLFQSEDSMLKALKRYKDTVLLKAKNIELSYPEETIQEFKRKGGKLLIDSTDAGQQQPNAGTQNDNDPLGIL